MVRRKEEQYNEQKRNKIRKEVWKRVREEK